jgi:hypothetical protein
MLLTFEDRETDSPFLERVWRSSSLSAGEFLSMAEGNIELVVTRLPDFVAVTLRGPVTRASLVECPADGEWLGIRFRLGAFFPDLATMGLLDHHDLNLPVLDGRRFWLSGLAWEIPTYDNAEALVHRLAPTGIVRREHSVDAVVLGDIDWMSRRSVQRRFLKTTGMTLSGFQQIARARHAAALLTDGRSILDTTHEAGYFDQAHLTRAVKQLIGTTPARLQREQPQLSFSYKTERA